MQQSQLSFRPNIIVVMTDDQDDVGSLDVMPKVEQLLVRQGIRFTNSFVNFPLCTPSRVSFLSGLAAHNHRVIGNARDKDGGYQRFLGLGLEDKTIGVWLQQAGYTTALMGKYLNGYDESGTVVPSNHVPPGWDEWHGMTRVRYFNFAINENGVVKRYGKSESSYSTDVLAQKAADFINRQAGKATPFLLLVTPKAPHADARPAPRHDGVYTDLPLPAWASLNEADVSDKPGFVQSIAPMDPVTIADAAGMFRKGRECLLAVDDMVETMVTALAQTDQLDNTFIIFTADHGHLYGQHRLMGKRVVYEESIRVPLVMRGPGIPHGQVRTQLVNNLDVVATIVQLANAVPGRVLDGESLVPLFRSPDPPWRTALLVEGQNHRSTRTTVGRFMAVRTSQYLYAEHQAEPGFSFGSETEFYDLASDPDQLVNKADDPNSQAVIEDLRQRLATLKTCSDKSCWSSADSEAAASSPARARLRQSTGERLRSSAAAPVDLIKTLIQEGRLAVTARAPTALRTGPIKSSLSRESSLEKPPPKFRVPFEYRRGALRNDERRSVDSALALLDLMDGIVRLDGAKILDFGCGVKLVQGLAERDDPHKKYVGLDVHSGLIEFLRANCSPDKFEFATVDFYNKMYNRHGQKMAPGCRLPISDDTFDLLTMFSVITHMEPGDASAILNILGSYAHRDSKLLFSAFVDAQQEEEFVDKDPEKPLRHAYYRKDFLERIIAEAGWKIIEDRPRIRSVIQHHYICARSSQP